MPERKHYTHSHGLMDIIKASVLLTKISSDDDPRIYLNLVA